MPSSGRHETGRDIQFTQPGHRRAPLGSIVANLEADADNLERDAACNHAERMQRRLALAASGATPTQLPELLRNFSRQAGRLASHPVNAVDNNPFITREWLIVSQVLHVAAATLENRFETLFLGR